MKFRFEKIAVNSVEKRKPTPEDQELYIGLEHLESGNLDVSSWGSKTPLKGEKLVMKKGDVLFGKRNTYLRRVAIAPFDGIFSAHGMILRPNRSVIDERFFPFFLMSDYFMKEAIRISVGSLSPTINWKDLKELEFNLPPIEEQARIADLLWAMNDTKKAYRNLLAATDELVKARFVEMFGDPESNPFGWKVVTLKDVCSSIVRGPFGSSLKKSFFVPRRINTYKVYEQKNAIQKSATIGSYYITEEKYQELKRFECVAGDFIMSCSGTMGEFYQLPVGCEKGIINQALCKFTLNNMILPSFFLTHMAQTISNLETRGSSIKNVAAVSTIIKMPINLPPIEKQKEFELFLNQVRETADIISNSQTQTEVLINSVIHNYLG